MKATNPTRIKKSKHAMSEIELTLTAGITLAAIAFTLAAGIAWVLLALNVPVGAAIAGIAIVTGAICIAVMRGAK